MGSQPTVTQEQFKIRYFFDGTDISTFNVFVIKSEGLLDAPKRKVAYRHNWLDESGEEVDLNTVNFEARTFKLNCFVKGDTITEALTNRDNLLSLIDQPGHRTLVVQYYGINDTITVKCFREEEVKLQKVFRYRKNIWTFTLTLKEFFE